MSQDLYPMFRAGIGGLTVDSVALCEQMRFLGRERIIEYLGHLNADDFVPVVRALQRLMGH